MYKDVILKVEKNCSRKMYSFYDKVSQALQFQNRISDIQNTCGNVILKQAGWSSNTEEILASQLVLVLRTSYDTSVLRQGRQIHTQMIISGITSNSLNVKMLGMYALSGSIKDARNMFYRLELCYTLPWNWMIRGLTMIGWFNFALLFYFKMLASKISPDKYTFPYVIKACGGLNNVRLGKVIHNTIQSMGYHMDLFVGSSLIKLYAENGYIHDAKCLFDKMPEKDGILWNVLLNGYVKSGDSNNAIGTFNEMRNCNNKPNAVTYSCILSVCAAKGIHYFGSQLHSLVIVSGFEFDSQVANTLLAMYAKCGNLSDAHKLFNVMPRTDTVSWNGLIAGYVQNGFTKEALPLFNKMISAGVKPDAITLSSFLPSVIESRSLKYGKEVHSYILRHSMLFDVYLKCALIDIYFKSGDVDAAQKIFQQSNDVDFVICTAMISGYALNGLNRDAINMFRCLIQQKMMPNCLTLASVLPACAALAVLKLGKEIHGNILKKGLDNVCHVGSAITDMYAKCGRLDLAYHFFRRLSERDSVCWNSMIASFTQNGKPEMAMELFRQMGMSGTKYDSVSLSTALSSCANLPSLYNGKEIHGFVIRTVSNADIFVESALIDMYSKCGKLVMARCLFDSMDQRNEVSWNSIITAYANHGYPRECLDLFHEMLKIGIRPDHVTFLIIISACGHAGLVDEGRCYFHRMTEEFGISAKMEHYSCMVDLYGRAGHLHEAFDTIKSMPFAPDAGVWGTLLGACRVHGNVELAKLASRHILELDPKNSGYYVLLSNIHAGAGEWTNVLKIRCLMKEKGVEKIPGYSWIDVNSITHMFSAADGSHPQSVEIYLILNCLLLELRKEGYVPLPYLPMHRQVMAKNQRDTK
ncbi:pentatricopeptide repeat-containing protein At4g21300-like [Neltuma alba]|uniref:pentatricopeptide repeat-containing protein At4g21300-like n=1 Tax=Neltuma alba TaxID=207710 RepID=UPI0010A3F6EA|nr:pentatricopeptide repeat-containing protein At4g21300-like [Prosopis alba]XP_028801988.1 pentatricopeptide repeat-containing protein At4g21300-like [Prosopis alba]